MKNPRDLPRLLALLTLATLLIPPHTLHACTLWGAAGTDAAGGTIVSKNRDWKPDHTQILTMRRTENAHAFFSLSTVYVGKTTEGVAAGVNEKGLTVFTAAAGSLPADLWNKRPLNRSVTTTLLQNFASCDQILAHKDAIFPTMRPAFIMIADRTKILTVEIALDGKYALKTTDQGVVAHTNHFLDPSLLQFNLKNSESSLVRLDRINHLLAASPKPCTIDSFAAMSTDQNDGPNNSIWRTSTAQTLASWIIHLPTQGPPRLRVLIRNPDQPDQTHHLTLDAQFWRETK